MGEELQGLRSSLHTIRTVRRAQFLGREAAGGIGGGSVDPLSSIASTVSLATTLIPLAMIAPPVAVALGITLAAAIGLNAVSQYIIDGQLAFPNPSSYISAADQMRRTVMEHVYGHDLGDKLWSLEFNTRQTEIDLRQKWPG